MQVYGVGSISNTSACGALSQIASSARTPSVRLPSQPAPSSSSIEAEQVLIGVARDAAFNFYYHECVRPRCKMPCSCVNPRSCSTPMLTVDTNLLQ